MKFVTIKPPNDWAIQILCRYTQKYDFSNGYFAIVCMVKTGFIDVKSDNKYRRYYEIYVKEEPKQL